jgi:hypothetical protein
LDGSFRNSKEWFTHIEHPSKWTELAKQLSLRNIVQTDQQNREIFAMSIEEDNPFQTTLVSKGSYNQLTDDFIKSEQFWAENLRRKCSKPEIEKCIK